MTNLTTATSAAPSVLVAQYVPSTGAAQYTAAVGTTAEFASVFLSNTDSVSRTVTVSIVKSGGSAGASNRVLPTITLAAGASLDLGQIFLGDGDFIWAEAGTASTITLVITGIEFSNATGAVLTGIQDDAIGTPGRTASSGTVTSTCAVGAANNRRLYGALMVTNQAGSVGYASYDTLTMSCTAGAMTRKVSVDFNNASALTGSIHIFEYVNPTSSTTQTLTASVVESGIAFNLTLASLSVSGVASSTVTATTGPSSAATLSLPISSAVGHRVLFAAGFNTTPMDFNQRIRGQNGNSTVGFTVPHWMIFADALGASTVTATTSLSDAHCAVALDLVPA